MEFDKNYVLSVAKEILSIDSPSGYTKNAILKVGKYAKELGYEFSMTNKGNAMIFVEGNCTEKTIGVCAHVDTLGLMVRSITSDGTLLFSKVGGIALPTLDGEYCKIYTRSGKVFTGTILSNSPASHVYKDAGTVERTEDKMHIRIDCEVKNKEDVEKLEISAGDYVCIDTKTIVTDTDFIKSRFLDDKLSVALILGVLKHFKDNNLKPTNNLKVLISTYEEVGHGMAFIPSGIDELIAVDMGCIGEDLSCTEYDVSICAKDSSGPYDYELTNKLVSLAKENNLSYALDLYPMYSSDVSATLRAGHDVRGALIGPGVHASHGMERSHYKGVLNTMKLLTLFLNS